VRAGTTTEDGVTVGVGRAVVVRAGIAAVGVLEGVIGVGVRVFVGVRVAVLVGVLVLVFVMVRVFVGVRVAAAFDAPVGVEVGIAVGVVGGGSAQAVRYPASSVR
jgi:hypothetical protein